MGKHTYICSKASHVTPQEPLADVWGDAEPAFIKPEFCLTCFVSVGFHSKPQNLETNKYRSELLKSIGFALSVRQELFGLNSLLSRLDHPSRALAVLVPKFS